MFEKRFIDFTSVRLKIAEIGGICGNQEMIDGQQKSYFTTIVSWSCLLSGDGCDNEESVLGAWSF